MGLLFAGRTDVGRKREHNEDSLLLNEKHGLFTIADGMGGHASGEVASKLAVDVLNEFIEISGDDSDITWPFEFDEGVSMEANRIFTAIKLANMKIIEVTQERKELEGMGTTLVTLLVQGEHAYIGHVGDSRAYLVRNNELSQLTSDHSWVNEQMKLGVLTKAEARNHPYRNVVTRALGGREVIKADLACEKLQPNDIILLCSDGLNSMIDDDRILEIILGQTDDLEACCQALVEAANNAGGDDNISVVLTRYAPS
ncbi:MAG: Stp1/IreP family PP2C-type Ser/Thr phosphatase [Acidobacteriota bacterium]